MNCKMSAPTLSLLGLMILSGTPLSPVSSASRMPTPAPAQSGQPQAGGADAEREAGRRALRRGDAGLALVHLENALRLCGQGGDQSALAATHDLLGELYEQQGNYRLALAHFQSAHNIYAAPPAKEDNYNANLMLAKIGDMQYRQGDLAAARGTYQLMKVKKPSGKASTFGGLPIGIGIGIGSRRNDVGEAAGAAGALFTAKKLFDNYRRMVIYADYEIGLGRVDYQNGQLESAQKHFENAESVAKGDLPGLGNLGQTRRVRVAARTGLGDVTLAQGRFKEAVKEYKEAAHDAEKEKRLDLTWAAQRGRGRSLWLQAGQEKDDKKSRELRAEALEAYRAALKGIEALRAGSLRADEARTTFLATTADVFDEAAGALAEMALTTADASRPLEGQALAYAAEAFQVVEQGRARALLDLLGEAGTNISEGVPPELFKRRRENLDRQAEIAQLLLGVTLSDKTPSKSVEHLEKEADQLQDEEAAIENEIRARSPRYNALTSPRPLTLAQVQQQVLDEGTALLEYSLGPEASYLWAVTRDAARLFKLPAGAKLNAHAEDLRQQILPPEFDGDVSRLTSESKRRGLRVRRQEGIADATSFARVSHKLYRNVLEPAAAFVGTRRLLIVPEGALSFVPFEALVTSPDGSDYASLAYLGKTNETVYAPSASVVAAVRQVSGGAPTPSTILVVADPVFDANDVRAKNLPQDASAAGGLRGLSVGSAAADVAATADREMPANFTVPRISGTRDEAEQIARTAGAAGVRAEKWLDFDASEANTKERDLKSYGVLHIATHGLLDAKRPQFSGLVLSLVGNKSGQDGFLRADEIFNLRLGSPLVMLSACETGLGKEKRGEGVMGLTRAFMYAGAPQVGVTLWSVDDKPSAELMADFYKNLLKQGGMMPAAALRMARQNMIAGRNKYSAPFYWAPFILVGDWRRG